MDWSNSELHQQNWSEENPRLGSNQRGTTLVFDFEKAYYGRKPNGYGGAVIELLKDKWNVDP